MYKGVAILFSVCAHINPDFDAQFAEDRLTNKYNLVAFDARAVSLNDFHSLYSFTNRSRLQHGETTGTPLVDVTLERKARCLDEGKL